MSASDSLHITALAVKEKANQLARRLRRNRPSHILSANASPERLILAPQDLRTSDAATAKEIYSGRFFLGGKLIDCKDVDPFQITDAPISWQADLHAFGWLRHLEAEGSAITKSNAQILVNDWLSTHAKPRSSLPWDLEITAKRLIAWICHSVPIVEASTPRFYQQWLKSIANHIRFLKYRANEADDGMPALIVRIALAYAFICVSDQQKALRHASRLLDQELNQQIAPDGIHISRNPAIIADLLALLLPLRQSYARLGLSPSQTLVSSIDRLMASLKFFQLGDGNLARFNGVSIGRPELISTVLFYDDSMGQASENATYSGFQRMAMGDTVLVADTGKPPEGPLSCLAHAGTLSFELSSGSNLIMVNCGKPYQTDNALTHLARSTAAHNTLTLNDTSSSRFYSKGRFANLLKNRKVSGPKQVVCKREDSEGVKRFTASQDGYKKSFGVIHTRTLAMSENGYRIEGEDRLTTPGGANPGGNRKLDFAIRFHLHPSISAGKTDDGNSIILMGGNGLVWKLTCLDVKPEIEESIFLTSSSGPKRSKQIVLSGDARSVPSIRWLITRQETLR